VYSFGALVQEYLHPMAQKTRVSMLAPSKDFLFELAPFWILIELQSVKNTQTPLRQLRRV